MLTKGVPEGRGSNGVSSVPGSVLELDERGDDTGVSRFEVAGSQ